MSDPSKQSILGVEGGATKTHWSLCEVEGSASRIVAKGTLGTGSMKLLEPDALYSLLSALPRSAGQVGVFLAGCVNESDRASLRSLCTEVWPSAVIQAGSDRESGFAAAFGSGDGIAVIAGTGSAVTGRRAGEEARAGGWGHLLGDSGGGYDLAIQMLRTVLFDFDTGQQISQLAADVLHVLGLNTLRELSGWAQTAKKSDLARLTPLLFEHAQEPAIQAILVRGAGALAELTASVAHRLNFPSAPIHLMGGVFLHQPLYRELFIQELAGALPGATVEVCETPGSLGAVFLAGGGPVLSRPSRSLPADESQIRQSPTEQRNPRSADLSARSASEMVQLFVEEEKEVEIAVRGAISELTRGVELIAESLREGGRLFYIGAGTSGRLGLLDASEMPPTFGVDPSLVQAILAGGIAAFQRSVEGAEDSVEAGEFAVRDRGVRTGDVLCGITASGRTPFVLGALAQRRKLGVHTILLTCNPQRSKEVPRADVEIDLATGPELITGSTRLKAGTATKLALNILSSCAMVLLGKVDGNLMSCLQPTNEKLRSRAAQIVALELQIPLPEARRHLECSNWNIRDAIRLAQKI